MMRHLSVLAGVGVLAAALPCAGQVTDFTITATPGTTSTGQDVVANVIAIDFTGLYTGSQILLELTAGEIININNVGDTAPSAFIAGLLPDYVFDTYIAQGALIEDDGFGTPGLGGGAVGLGGAAEAAGVFNDALKISLAYNPAGGANIRDKSDFVVAQIALTPDAVGTFQYFASPVVDNVDQNFITGVLPIVGGVILPEPGTLGAWLGLATLGLCCGHRRRQTLNVPNIPRR